MFIRQLYLFHQVKLFLKVQLNPNGKEIIVYTTQSTALEWNFYVIKQV